MRITMVSDCYAPRLGGIESQVRDLAIHLHRAGHDVLVVTATRDDNAPAPHMCLDEGVRVWRINLPLAGPVPVNPLAGPQLLAAMRGADITHIHTGVISPVADHAAILAARHRLPAVVTWHCMLTHWAHLFTLLRHRQYTARRGVVHTAVSTVMAERISRILSAPVGIVPNGTDLQIWRAIAQERLRSPRQPGPIRIVSSRRLARIKRNDTLVAIVAQARQHSGRECELTIYGEGPGRPTLEQLRDRLGASWLHLPGRATRADLAAAYRYADIYLSTSTLEAFGIATLEGRASGLPVIAPTATGVDDFCADGRGAILGADDDALVKALTQLLSDDDMREQMARYNAQIPPQQDWSEVLPTTLAVYEQAMAGGNGRHS